MAERGVVWRPTGTRSAPTCWSRALSDPDALAAAVSALCEWALNSRARPTPAPPWAAAPDEEASPEGRPGAAAGGPERGRAPSDVQAVGRRLQAAVAAAAAPPESPRGSDTRDLPGSPQQLGCPAPGAAGPPAAPSALSRDALQPLEEGCAPAVCGEADSLESAITCESDSRVTSAVPSPCAARFAAQPGSGAGAPPAESCSGSDASPRAPRVSSIGDSGCERSSCGGSELGELPLPGPCLSPLPVQPAAEQPSLLDTTLPPEAAAGQARRRRGCGPAAVQPASPASSGPRRAPDAAAAAAVAEIFRRACLVRPATVQPNGRPPSPRRGQPLSPQDRRAVRGRLRSPPPPPHDRRPPPQPRPLLSPPPREAALELHLRRLRLSDAGLGDVGERFDPDTSGARRRRPLPPPPAGQVAWLDSPSPPAAPAGPPRGGWHCGDYPRAGRLGTARPGRPQQPAGASAQAARRAAGRRYWSAREPDAA
eukprot:TRINITY_DN2760_c2_g1_i1.p1 TRINITY_DN2760_c2_g1~~TRINITY_DN2760_c2_g1_i1.p1  ORF type:complete len:500 (+),score=99.37 TRINITY_DN2760_c2_g1_i1:55-1500(+)